MYEPGWWGPGLSPEQRSAGHRGWYVVGGWVGLMVLAACYLVVDGLRGDPGDPGLADVAFFLSPVIAFAAACSTALLVALAAAFRGVDLGPDTRKVSYAHAIWVAPILYLGLLLAGAGLLDALRSMLAYGIVMFLAPVLVGAGSVLLLAVPTRRRATR